MKLRHTSRLLLARFQQTQNTSDLVNRRSVLVFLRFLCRRQKHGPYLHYLRQKNISRKSFLYIFLRESQKLRCVLVCRKSDFLGRFLLLFSYLLPFFSLFFIFFAIKNSPPALRTQRQKTPKRVEEITIRIGRNFAVFGRFRECSLVAYLG